MTAASRQGQSVQLLVIKTKRVCTIFGHKDKDSLHNFWSQRQRQRQSAQLLIKTTKKKTGCTIIGHHHRRSCNVPLSQESCHSLWLMLGAQKWDAAKKNLKMANVELHLAELKCKTNSPARSFEVHWPWVVAAAGSLVMAHPDRPQPRKSQPWEGVDRPNLYNCHLEKYDFSRLPHLGTNSFGVERCPVCVRLGVQRKLFSQLRGSRSLTRGRNSNSKVNFGC